MLNVQIQEREFYADKVNGQFHKSQSHYVNLAQRLRESINEESWKEMTLANSVEVFKQNNPNKKTWEDFTFCQSVSTTLDKIDIDITLQRLLDLIHGCNIIDHFSQVQVMPICVYEDANRPGRYICWDGQHTAIVLYVIATKVLGLDYSKCQVPIVIYASHQKSEMRECFINLNGEWKKPLDNIDKVHQKIFGVRTDGSKNPEWLLINDKQKAIEGSKMFLTHTKFGDTDQPGAYTRLDELLDPQYDLSITQYFAKYFFSVCNSSRPVQPKESWMLYEYFRYCRIAKIEVTDLYIAGVAKSLRKPFNDDFDASALYDQAKLSYQEWFRLNKPNPDGTIWGITYPEQKIGLTYLVKQIAKNFDGSIPKIHPLWPVPDEDLI
jgi:hypothetical protein